MGTPYTGEKRVEEMTPEERELQKALEGLARTEEMTRRHRQFFLKEEEATP